MSTDMHQIRIHNRARIRTLNHNQQRFFHRMVKHFYAASTLHEQTFSLKYLNTALALHGLVDTDVDALKAWKIFSKWAERRPHALRIAKNVIKRYYSFLVEQGVIARPPEPPKSPRDSFLADYSTQYLKKVRGLSSSSTKHALIVARHFLDFQFLEGFGDFSKLTPEHVAEFLYEVIKKRKPRSSQLLTHTRHLLRYLFTTGITATDLSECVTCVGFHKEDRLPSYLSDEDVLKVLQAAPRETPFQRRDFAILVLLAYLGLRPQELQAILLDDINWREGEILIRGKGQYHDIMPLPKAVGEAIVDYLQNGRPKTTSRFLFISSRAPREAFPNIQFIRSALRDAVHRVGLLTDRAFIPCNIFRHSLARRLVKRQAPFPEIGNLLRHRSLATTMVYARVDVEGLRSIARPWPISGKIQ